MNENIDTHFRALLLENEHLAQTTEGLGNLSQLNIDTPELQELPQKLWAKDQCDVGFIKGAKSILVTPKSTYCPCPAQYPLKPETVEGITPAC